MAKILLVNDLTPSDGRPAVGRHFVIDTVDAPITADGTINEGGVVLENDEATFCLEGVVLPETPTEPTDETSFIDLHLEGDFFFELIPLPVNPLEKDKWRVLDKDYVLRNQQLPMAFKAGERLEAVPLTEDATRFRIINGDASDCILRVYKAGGEINLLDLHHPTAANAAQVTWDNSEAKASMSVFLKGKTDIDCSGSLPYAGIIDMGNLAPDEANGPLIVSVNGANYDLVQNEQELTDMLGFDDIALIKLTEWTPGNTPDPDPDPETAGSFSYVESYYNAEGNDIVVWAEATTANSELAITTPDGVTTKKVVNGEEELHLPYQKGLWKITGDIESLLNPPVYLYVDSALTEAPAPATNVTTAKQPDGKWKITCITAPNTVCGLVPTTGSGGEPVAFAIPDETGLATFNADVPDSWTGSIRVATSGGGSTGATITLT